MTTPALIRKPDMIRAAEVAKQTGCRVEIKIGDAVITVIPDDNKRQSDGIDYGKPVL